MKEHMRERFRTAKKRVKELLPGKMVRLIRESGKRIR